MKLDNPLKLNFDVSSSPLKDHEEVVTNGKERHSTEGRGHENTLTVNCEKLALDLENRLNELLDQLQSRFDKGLLNACIQIEKSIGLQNYLSVGDLPLSYHGWSISPDLAVFLVEKIEEKHYDFIIEFGSGTSTCLMGKALLNKINKNFPYSERADSSADHDHPKAKTLKKILCFEHKEMCFDKTSYLVKHHCLEEVVDLVFAPLVDYDYDGQEYLYYDCDAKLLELANSLGSRGGNILVLVDGPPGATGPLARFPALIKILEHMPNCRFDIVLDDYNRHEEKKIVSKWRQELRAKAVKFSEEELSLEKGAVLISIKQ